MVRSPPAPPFQQRDYALRRAPCEDGALKRPVAAKIKLWAWQHLLAPWRRGAPSQTPERAAGARGGPERMLGPPRGPATARRAC